MASSDLCAEESGVSFGLSVPRFLNMDKSYGSWKCKKMSISTLQPITYTAKPAQARNIPTNVSTAIKIYDTITLCTGGAAAATGTKDGVLVGLMVAATNVMFEVWVITAARGIVNVTTDDPFAPHPAQLCVVVVTGTFAGVVAVAHAVKVMHDVRVTSWAGFVLHTVMYVTVDVMVVTLAATAVPGAASAGAGDGMVALTRRLRYTVNRTPADAARRVVLVLPPQNSAELPVQTLLQLSRLGRAPVPASRVLAQ